MNEQTDITVRRAALSELARRWLDSDPTVPEDCKILMVIERAAAGGTPTGEARHSAAFVALYNWVTRSIERVPKERLSSSELLAEASRYFSRESLPWVGEVIVRRWLRLILLLLFGLEVCHDVRREGRCVRGWRGVRLKP
jgi:hypothetical protein